MKRMKKQSLNSSINQAKNNDSDSISSEKGQFYSDFYGLILK